MGMNQTTAILMICMTGSKTPPDALYAITYAAARRFPDFKRYITVTGQGGKCLAAVDGQYAKLASANTGRDSMGLVFSSLTQALAQAAADGMRKLAVQPMYLLDGSVYSSLLDTLSPYHEQFESIIVGKPLLACDTDRKAAVKALMEKTAAYNDGETAVCFMGHGTKAAANSVYEDMQEQFWKCGYKNYYIGTLHAEPSLDTIIKALRAGGYKKVVLAPFMIVAGTHARRDLAGKEPDSWKSILEREGYQVTCILEGFAQMPQFQKVYLSHLEKTLEEVSSVSLPKPPADRPDHIGGYLSMK